MEETSYYLTFVRHGESVGNFEKRFQGQADFPLTEAGRAQAHALADRWLAEGRTFERCVASPLLRARETAEILTGTLNVPLEFDPEWMEVNNGRFAGLTGPEIESQFVRTENPTPYTRYGETGESRWELFLRAGRLLQRIADGEPGHILVVSHGGLLNMVLYAAFNITLQANHQGPRFDFGNTGFAVLRYKPENHNWRLIHFETPSSGR